MKITLIDDDKGTLRAMDGARVVNEWAYTNETLRQTYREARAFCEGWQTVFYREARAFSDGWNAARAAYGRDLKVS
jgi:hypothetical protein